MKRKIIVVSIILLILAGFILYHAYHSNKEPKFYSLDEYNGELLK